MKLEEAIEIMEREEEDTFMGSEKKWKAAVKLSIEAMKLVDNLRFDGSPYYPNLLPGETE